MKLVSRRLVLRSVVSLPVVVTYSRRLEAESSVCLAQLGFRLDALAAEMDQAIDQGTEIADKLLNEFERIESQIIATPATTIDGLRVKARAACWALLGDLEAGDQSTTDKRMALSIVRDLIRLYDPELERPGALKDLVKEVEEGAGLAPAA